MTATEQIKKYVTLTRESAKQAEKEYDAAAREIQLKSQNSINIFGGNATSQVADIAAMSKKACESLYASYQTLVRMLDENCRPLLAQDPDADSVKQVADLITWLNDESEIENNFTASFNSASLGDVASVRFFPTMENKMIQQYWAQKYREMPDYEENERKIEAKKEAERQARLKRRDEEKVLAKKWEEEKKVRNEHYTKAADACKAKEKDFQNELEQYLEKKKSAITKVNGIVIANLEKQKKEEVASLAELNTNQEFEKQYLSNHINELEDRIVELKSTSEDKDFKVAKKMAEAASEEYKKQTADYLKKRFPFDQKLFEERYRKYITGDKKDILNALEKIGAGTVEQVTAAVRNDFSSQKCSALLRQLVLEGIVRREVIYRETYYEIDNQAGDTSAAKSPLSSDIDGFYEDFSVTDDSMPMPPRVEEIFNDFESLTDEYAEEKATEVLLRMKQEDDKNKNKCEDDYIDKVYRDAVRLSGSSKLTDLQTAKRLFGKISDKRDVKKALAECTNKIGAIESENDKHNKKIKRVIITFTIAVVAVLGAIFGIQYKINSDVSHQLTDYVWHEKSDDGIRGARVDFKKHGKMEVFRQSEYTDSTSYELEWSIKSVTGSEVVLEIGDGHNYDEYYAERDSNGEIKELRRERFDESYIRGDIESN